MDPNWVPTDEDRAEMQDLIEQHQRRIKEIIDMYRGDFTEDEMMAEIDDFETQNCQTLIDR